MNAIDLIGWAAAALLLAVVVSQLAGWGDGRVAALIHAFTPPLLLTTLPLAAGALLLGRFLLLSAFVVLAVLAGFVLSSAVRPGRSARPEPLPSSPTLTVLHSNVLYKNRRRYDAAHALLAAGADVLIVCEMTAALHAALDEHGALDRYPHRIGQDGKRGEGIAVWSTRPFAATRAVHLGGRDALTVTIDVEGASFDVMAVHLPTPTSNTTGDQWGPALRAIGRLAGQATAPTVVTGDFNATRWHAPFRSILDAGYRDVHEMFGRGLSASWPLEGRVMPPCMRLDHALVNDLIAPVSLRDLTIPGSDHRALMVTVALAAR